MPRLATISSARAGASAPVFYQGPELPTASTSVYLRALALRRLPAWRTSGDGALLAKVEAKLHQLLEFYAVKNADEVRRFLRVSPEAADVLLEARPHIERIFGPVPRMTLEVTFDPDSENPADSEELFAYIPTCLPVEEALDRLHQLDQKWFLNQLHRVRGRVNFNLDFV